MCWLQAEQEAQYPPLQRLLTAMDAAVACVRNEPSLEHEPSLKDQLHRREVQLTCYPGGGARYVRHVDALGGAGSVGRRVTCIYYANPSWKREHGGELRLHSRRAAGGSAESVDVAPLANRLIVFWSDDRVPHSVLPTHAPRFAVSAWRVQCKSESNPLAEKPAVRLLLLRCRLFRSPPVERGCNSRSLPAPLARRYHGGEAEGGTEEGGTAETVGQASSVDARIDGLVAKLLREVERGSSDDDEGEEGEEGEEEGEEEQGEG